MRLIIKNKYVHDIMVCYECSKCGKTFRKKSNYLIHQLRKYECSGQSAENHHAILHDTPPSDQKCAICVENGTVDFEGLPAEKPFENQDFSPKMVHATTISLKNLESGINETTLECYHCRKKYKNRKSLVRHVKSCKMLEIFNNTVANSQNGALVTSEKKTINNIMTTINNNQVTNNKNTQNIIYVDNRICSDTKLKPFGKENLGFLTEAFLQSVIIEPEEGILRLIEKVHFNKDVPENQNIQIKNKKEPYIDIFNGKKWEKQDKKTAIQNIITTKKDIMDDFVEEHDETKLINKFVKENYDTFSKMLNEYIMHTLDSYDERVKSRVLIKCMSFYKEICKQAELLLINNKKNANSNVNAPTIEN